MGELEAVVRLTLGRFDGTASDLVVPAALDPACTEPGTELLPASPVGFNPVVGTFGAVPQSSFLFLLAIPLMGCVVAL